MTRTETTPPASPATTARLLRACAGQALDRPPVWFMRQAGRSLPEYRKLREGTTMLQACQDPELITEITLQPVRRHGVDAAILFSDIVLPLVAVGVGVDIVAGVGPVVAAPIRSSADVAALPDLTPADVSYVSEAIALLRAELGDVPLIGFAGAPFTLASYLIEGGPSRDHAKTKALMRSDPPLWHALLERLSAITGEFLAIQVAAGVAAVQLFDSWVGALSAADYREFVAPHSAAVLARVDAAKVPKIHFGVGTNELLPQMRGVGAQVVGVDWRIPLDEAARRVGPGVALQGNLDPALLFADWEVLEREVARIVGEGRRVDGHIFNLGHGVLPQTDPGVISAVVDYVKSLA